MKNKLIDSFHKNSIEIVKVNLQEWKGRKYLDVRVWLLDNAAKSGGKGPTRKGITLSVEFLPRLIKALEKAQKILARNAFRGSESNNLDRVRGNH